MQRIPWKRKVACNTSQLHRIIISSPSRIWCLRTRKSPLPITWGGNSKLVVHIFITTQWSSSWVQAIIHQEKLVLGHRITSSSSFSHYWKRNSIPFRLVDLPPLRMPSCVMCTSPSLVDLLCQHHAKLHWLSLKLDIMYRNSIKCLTRDHRIILDQPVPKPKVVNNTSPHH